MSPQPKSAMVEGSGIVVILETGSLRGLDERTTDAHPGPVHGVAYEAGATVWVKATPKGSAKSAKSLRKASLKIK
jgi:hypothetical protein